MHSLLDRFLNFSKSRIWALFATTTIGAFLGASAIKDLGSTRHWVMSVGGGASLGLVSGLLLLGADSYRRRTGSDHVSPIMGIFLVVGFFGVTALVIFLAFLVMTR
jgi:hypothetical protein